MQVSLDELKGKAEVLSLHIPLTDSTNYLVDDQFISEMKNDF
jgi:D-3-phosphoglycerate dehydrogenase